jgi:hypothetical protein
MPWIPVLVPSGFSIVGICVYFKWIRKKSMNPIKEKKMKMILKFCLCAALIFGLAISAAVAAQDSETQEVVQENQSSKIKELTIRNSGFRSRATIVIRYRDEDKKIVEVIENGRKLPSEEFGRYESVIREVLEIPQIDRLLPEIDRARRRVESPRISEESKIREMLAMRRRLEGLESGVARRYRDWNELQLMETLNNLTEKISDSSDLSQEEKIEQLKEIIEKIQALEMAKKEEDRRRRHIEFGAVDAARRLIEEIEKSSALSKQEKIKELKEVLQRIKEIDLNREEARRRDLIGFEIANALRKMLQETAQRKDLSDQEKKKELEFVTQEARDMELSESIQRMVGIEKFKFDLHQILKNEELLPEGEAEFVLKLNECTVDGKKVSKEIHRKILQLCEKDLGKKFTRDTKIILRLNEDR